MHSILAPQQFQNDTERNPATNISRKKTLNLQSSRKPCVPPHSWYMEFVVGLIHLVACGDFVCRTSKALEVIGAVADGAFGGGKPMLLLRASQRTLALIMNTPCLVWPPLH